MKRIVATLLMFSLMSALRLPHAGAVGAIYIRADGSVDPPHALIASEDGVTFSFSGNVRSSVVVERDNIVVDGRGYLLKGTGASGTYGFSLTGRTNVTIQNVEIDYFWHGIMMVNCTDNSIRLNTVSTHYDGIVIVSSSNITVSNNNITGNYDDGVWLEEGANNTVSDNYIAGSSLTNHDYAITLHKTSKNMVHGNIIENSEHGVGFYQSRNNTVSANTITMVEQYAIWLLQSSGNTMSRNNVTHNKCGVWLSHSSQNIFYGNNFVNNTCQVESVDSINVWNHNASGNYWSDYAGQDDDANGTGDTPYNIDEHNEDDYPSVTILSETPLFIMILSAANLLIILSMKKRVRNLSSTKFFHCFLHHRKRGWPC